jgi:hypothetical protein
MLKLSIILQRESEGVMLSTHVEYDTEENIVMPKGQRTEVADTITVDGKEYATVSRAQKILTELATELEKPREYSRFAVFRLAIAHNIDIITTPSANYYSVEGLYGLKDKLHPERGARNKSKHYSDEVKQQALALYTEGLSNRQIAKRLEVSYQTVNNWIKSLIPDSQKKRNSS